ncbi:hypothetical protein KQI38_02385 [Tissierella carlieri]|mgnify:CR=1 FL=1|uniref:hypothetical protein n=1 Tax=Tissierella carlieri TaxID=689904 RepID=UPI001C0F6AB6|nr:hypothetical protein [Tissierella carlieri]MBU5310866.1 hypothetical protein [Tissierella carlieri]
MRQKNKFTTFLLSFIPGLSHFYLGYADRGFIYLLIFGMLCVGTIGLSVLTYREEFLILLVGVPIIWLVALIDAFSTINAMRYGDSSEIKNIWNSQETKISNKKIITLALSIIPGAGHMYLGYQKKGLVLMGGFFFAIFFMGWLQLSFLLFLLPLIWFYSFFDAFHTLNGSDVEDMDISKLLPTIKPEYIGMGLVGIGVLVALQKVFYPILSQVLSKIFNYHNLYQVRNYIQTSIVALIFIIGGIKILHKNKNIVDDEMEEDDEEYEE